VRLVIAVFLLASAANAQEPFRIIGNIYYVGGSDVTSFLIATPKGHILIDAGYQETAAEVERNIEKLGFKLHDIKILLNSHAHLDHAGGLAELKRVTGARFYASAGDTPLLARGGVDDPQFGNRFLFPPIQPDHIIKDGERVSIDGATLVAHLTPGHTPGCTTYTMTAGGKHVVFFCSPTVPNGYRLVGNPRYPNAVEDYRKEFAVLHKLPCDVPLGSHGSFFDLDRKRNTRQFIDPKGCAAFLSQMEQSFEKELAREQDRP